MQADTFQAVRAEFESNKRIQESTLLSFKNTDGADVFNCSIPFTHKGRTEVYGRLEKRDSVGDAHVRRFVQSGSDEFTQIPDQVAHQLEDPFIAKAGSELLLGGVRTIKSANKVCNFYCDFYRGSPAHVNYYSTGPDRVRGVRVVELATKELGVFSTISTAADSASAAIGFLKISKLEELTSDKVASAVPIDGSACTGVNGYVHQAYLLSTGLIGCIAHHDYTEVDGHGHQQSGRCATSFVYDPASNKVCNSKVIATRSCFPQCPSKSQRYVNHIYPSGIVMRDDGKCDLFCGLGDTCEGRVTIDYPFEGHGEAVTSNQF